MILHILIVRLIIIGNKILAKKISVSGKPPLNDKINENAKNDSIDFEITGNSIVNLFLILNIFAKRINKIKMKKKLMKSKIFMIIAY